MSVDPHPMDRLTDGKTAKIVLNFSGELKEIQESHPQLAAKVDVFNQAFRERMEEVKKEIDRFPDEEQELVRILVINGMHKTADEVFL